MSRDKNLRLGLLLICLSLGWLLSERWRQAGRAFQLPAPASAVAQSRAAKERENSPADPYAPTLASYQEIIQRPLFIPERRRASQKSGQSSLPSNQLQPASPQAPTDLRLSGVIINAEQKMALLSVPGGKTERLTIGESFQGWLVVAIQARNIMVDKNGAQYQIPLQIPRSGTADAAPEASAQAPPDPPAEQAETTAP